MSTFEQSRGIFQQTHFTVVELDLPVVEGECTISGEPGFGTPASCDQPSNATRTYKFCTIEAPLLPESDIWRCVTNLSETPTKLTGSLASRGTASITFVDFEGKDPNKDAPAVTQEVIQQGSFLAKLNSRNELTNKEVRIKNYRLESDGSIDLENGSETRYYIVDSFDYQGKSKWSMKLKDELSRVNIDESVWPIPLEGYLINDISNTLQTFRVDPNVDYQVDDAIRVGDEFMKINAVTNIGTSNAEITVNTRGVAISYTETLTLTTRDEHSAGDEVYLCEVSDNERIDDLLERILIDIGIDSSYIPKADWVAEIDEWHPLTRVNTIWYESQDTVDVLKSILDYYLLDMWFDPVDREIKLSAVSVWRESSQLIEENDQIEYDSVKRKRNENLRVTRAFVVYDKRFLASSDSVENFKQASLFRRTELETDDFFGEPKTKQFDYSRIIDSDSADLLVNRWVNRNINPIDYTWKTPERKLNFKTGDVVDIRTLDKVGFDGLPANSARAQITSIKPNYKREGRDYTVTALSYEPVFSTGSEVIITGNLFDVNLYIQYAGAPSQPVELTFIFDGVTAGSSGSSVPAIRAGAFPAGSKLIIILANGSDLMAKGGRGGDGGGAFFDQELDRWFPLPQPGNGENGGTVFDAEGIDCDIYFSGTTPSSSYPDADGYITAPSGGDGGFDANVSAETGGNGGNGGDGRIAGEGGNGRALTNNSGEENTGTNGEQGTDNRLTGSFGLDGANNNAVGGKAGRGVVDSGATVNFFGEAGRYVNGGGDH